MNSMQAPLQVWVHLGADLTRNLLQLPTSPDQWQQLKQKLTRARADGVDGIIVPISWRQVAPYRAEQAEQARSWQAYDRLFGLIRHQGLQIIPDLGLVARGMTDVRYMSLLPDWLWGQLQAELPADMPLDSLKYLDQHGRDSIMATSLWASRITLPYFRQFMQGFATHLAEHAGAICHLQLSVGPGGEWRYPFLGLHAEDGLSAYFPCYSELALYELAKAMLRQYGGLSEWQQAWSMSGQLDQPAVLKDVVLAMTERLLTPQSGVAEQDFCRWYHGSLVAYGQELLTLTHAVFADGWQHSTLGLRLPGRLPHLLPENPQLAELIAGMLPLVRVEERVSALTHTLGALVPEALRARCRLILTGIGVKHGESEPGLLGDWLAAAGELKLPVMAENGQRLSLDDHPQWEHLVGGVLNHRSYAGWVIRDLDVLLSGQVGENRLRELARLRRGQGQVERLNRKLFRVMGPLHLKVANQRQLLSEQEWQQFADQVRLLRRMGVTAISTDLWWGLIEGRQSGLFDWSYYDRLVALLAHHDMQWVPILSFHQAGGNVNDDFMQTIPLWLWGKLLESHPALNSVRDLQYVSETGDASMEYVSLWADEFVMPYYERFISAFRDHFASLAGRIAEINLSLGPAGELRYPSYNAHDWGNYPNRGTLQCYSPLAEQDWRRHLKTRYGSITGLNYAFGTRYADFDSIPMPIADHLFTNKEYVYSAWAREFLGWYHGALVAHGRRILEMALTLFEAEPWRSIPLGIKVPGIHWEISDPASPRVAEITAGLIKPHPTLGPQNQREYVQLLDQLVPSAARTRVALHFTCLEMINKDYEGYSRAADLVGWFADAAHELGIGLMGENALAGELYGEQGWRQIAHALKRSPGYGGITFLRMQNFFDEDKTPRDRLQWLINQFQ